MSRNATRNKITRLILRNGPNCWLCGELVDTAVAYLQPMCGSLDHYVPRKWGGMNNMENLRLAHAICNHDREHRLPESLIFRVSEIVALTNRNSAQGGLSQSARKALRHAVHPPLAPREVAEIEHTVVVQNPLGKKRWQSHYARRVLEEPASAWHPDMPIEKC